MAGEYFFQLVSKVLRGKALDLSVVDGIQRQLQEQLSSGKLEDVEKTLSSVEKKYAVDLKEAHEYAETLAGNVLSYGPSGRMRAWEGTFEALKETFSAGNQGMRVINKRMSYEEIKELTRELVRYCFETSREETPENRFALPFLLSENCEVEGDFIMRFGDHLQNVGLTSIYYEASTRLLHVRLFGEGRSNSVKARAYSEAFYQYRFMGEDRKEYLIFSKDEIPNGRAKVTGMYCGVVDDLKLATATSRMPAIMGKLEIIFATSVVSQVQTIDLVRFKELTWGWTADSMAESVLGKFRHPPWFEKFILAWLFSGKASGFPLHWMMLAPPGTGKTQLIENIVLHKFREFEVVDGSINTLKYVIPHYGGTFLNPGAFARCRRVCGLDEFFTMLRRNNYSGKDADADTGLLTALLEHKERMGGSGKHESSPIRASAKALMATNPRYGLANMADCAESLNKAFMTRSLWYVQTAQHVAFVQNNQPDLVSVPLEQALPAYDPRFIEVYDFLNSSLLDVEQRHVRSIFAKFKELVPLDLQTVYVGRSYHHIVCLIDGIAKVNSIIEQRPVLEVLQSDVDEAEQIFGMMIASWNENLNLKAMPAYIRKGYLALEDRLAYDFIDKNPGCSLYAMEQAGITSAGMRVTKLEDADLVTSTKLDGKWEVFPYWFKGLGAAVPEPGEVQQQKL